LRGGELKKKRREPPILHLKRKKALKGEREKKGSKSRAPFIKEKEKRKRLSTGRKKAGKKRKKGEKKG